MSEWLAEVLDLRPGMRVLDFGCGRAASSICAPAGYNAGYSHAAFSRYKIG